MVGELIAGRYELEELVGKGGMSTVYRAKDRLLERTVAIKLLHEHFSRDEDYVERFRREARAAAQLSHPNIVTVIDRGEDAGRQFIVFEYIDGQNLKQLVEHKGRLPVRTALELGVYELLAGEPPYSGDNFVAVAMRHVNDPVPSVIAVRPDVPLRLDAALRRAMAKDPDDRFPSMSEFVNELEAVLDGLGEPD